MSSYTKKTQTLRRQPTQERAEERIKTFLRASEIVFAQHGFAGATMTQIATDAGASIGAIYQYFPNKEALAVSLRSEYAQQMDHVWSSLQESLKQISVAELVNAFFDLMTSFIDRHPAYLALLDAPIGYVRDRKSKDQLRERLGKLLVTHGVAFETEATMKASVVLQIVKGLIPLYAEAKGADKAKLVSEFKSAVLRYLQ